MIAPYGRTQHRSPATPTGVAVAFFCAVAATMAMLLATAPPAAAAPADTLADLANVARSAQGKSPLARNAALDAVARGWAQKMASAGRLSHNPDVAEEIPGGWRRVGENVAQGYRTAAQMHSGWMNSSGHRANILGDYTDIGVAFVESGGTTWGVQVFATYPNGAARPAPSTPSPTKTAAPRPKASATPTVRKPTTAPRTPRATPSRTPSPSATATTPTPTPTPTPSPSATASEDAVPGAQLPGPGDDETRQVAAGTPPASPFDRVGVVAVGGAALLAVAAAFGLARRRSGASARHRG